MGLICSRLLAACFLHGPPLQGAHDQRQIRIHFYHHSSPSPTGHLQPVADPHPLLPLAQDEGQVQASGEGIVRDGRVHPLTVSSLSALCLRFFVYFSYELSLPLVTNVH